MIKATEIRKGMIIRFQDRIMKVMESHHVTPGKGVACMQVLMKDVEKGNNKDFRFRPDEKVEPLEVDQRKMEYLYQEGESFIFMDMSSYEQLPLSQNLVGDVIGYVLPNSQIDVAFIDGRPIYIEIPQKVSLKVVETDPGIKNA